jgi:hypothetical protein
VRSERRRRGRRCSASWRCARSAWRSRARLKRGGGGRRRCCGAYAAFAVVAAVASALLAISAAWVLITVPEEAAPPSSPPPAWDLPARVALTIALVLAITGAAGTLGPALSGVLTPFPIATAVVAFSLAQDGPAASRSLLRGFVRALPGIALCFFLAALAL